MATDYAATATMIDSYQNLRRKCYEASQRNKGELMGGDRWLVHALSETDLELDVTSAGVRCTGSTYTTQTMDNEWFDFTIPFSELS